jgi:hypothetical protein
MDVGETEWEGVKRTRMAQTRNQWRFLLNTVMIIRAGNLCSCNTRLYQWQVNASCDV